jgi:hypothetical protein
MVAGRSEPYAISKICFGTLTVPVSDFPELPSQLRQGSTRITAGDARARTQWSRPGRLRAGYVRGRRESQFEVVG